MENLELTTVIAAAAMVAAQGRDLQVKSDDDLLTAVGFLGKVKTALDQVERQRAFFVGPLNSHVKAINAMFKGITGPLEVADQTVRGKVANWKQAETIRIAEQKRQVEEAKAARRAIAEAQGEATDEQVQVLAFTPDVADTPIKRVHTDGGSAQFRKVWKVEIINEAEVPRQFLSVDMIKLRIAVGAGIREIPGVRIYEEEQLAVSGNV